MDPSGADRDLIGRFSSGHPKLGGRRRGQTLSAELRRQGDPEAIAARLLEVIFNQRTNAREVLQAITLYADRVEGRAVSRNVSMTLGASQALPPEFGGMSLDERRAALRVLRERALAGELVLADGGETEVES